MPPHDDFIPDAASPRILAFFQRFIARPMIRKHFNALRIARSDHAHLPPPALADHPGPLLCLINHPSWWDPITGLLLHQLLLPRRTGRVPMDSAQLRKFMIFTRLGTFGINPDNPASLQRMAEHVADYFSKALARHQRPTLWVTPQGRFTDVRERPPLRPGTAAIAAAAHRAGHAPIALAIALELAFWTDRRPELLVRLQPVDSPPPDRANDTTAWHRAITTAFNHNQDQLAQLAIARDPDAFATPLAAASAGVHPLYNLWLKLRGADPTITDRTRAPQRTA